jgi:putative lipoic acid-binding regulatory protein
VARSEGRSTPFQFPCRFPIKVVGRADPGFKRLVIGIVRRHAPDLDESLVTVRGSRGGKWVSVTVLIQATSREQLDVIYRDLTSHEQVTWAI